LTIIINIKILDITKNKSTILIAMPSVGSLEMVVVVVSFINVVVVVDIVVDVDDVMVV